jgi:hypothetical protein
MFNPSKRRDMTFFKRPDKVNNCTFEVYWSTFYFHNPQRSKIRKFDARRLFDDSNCSGGKRRIIKGLKKGIKINAFEYLRNELNKY